MILSFLFTIPASKENVVDFQKILFIAHPEAVLQPLRLTQSAYLFVVCIRLYVSGTTLFLQPLLFQLDQRRHFYACFAI